MNYIFYGGIADGALAEIEVQRIKTNTPQTLWVLANQGGDFDLGANIQGYGTPYRFVGIDANGVAHYHVHVRHDIHDEGFMNNFMDDSERHD